MIKFAVVFLFGVVWGGRLENTYLPPGSAKTAGGNGNLLETPFSNGNGATVVGNGDFGNGALPPSTYGAPISASSRIGSDGRNFGPISNGSYRRNGQSNGFGFNGGKSLVPSFNGAIGNGAKLSPEYGAPVISGGTNGEGPSFSTAGNGNGLSPVYGVPSQNGIHTGGRLAAPVNILRYNNENDGTGIYRFEYETENHISQQERGDLKNAGAGGESSVVQGTYSYAGPDGHTYTVNYIADENGFQPTGEHIHLAVQAAAADAARTAAAEGKAGGYPSAGQYQATGNDGYRY